MRAKNTLRAARRDLPKRGKGTSSGTSARDHPVRRASPAMGKASAHRAKEQAKKAIKDKKKFKNKNSIGKTKKKVGSAGRHPLVAPVNKLQRPLKDFGGSAS